MQITNLIFDVLINSNDFDGQKKMNIIAAKIIHKFTKICLYSYLKKGVFIFKAISIKMIRLLSRIII